MWGEPQYDEHQFLKQPKSVSQRTKLAFADIERMHVERRKSVARRLPIPLWSQNDVELREVVLQFCESYLYVRPPANATNEERLKAIAEKQRAWVPVAQANLKRTLERYHRAANDPSTDAEDLRRLGILVAIFDKQVVLLRDRNLASLLTSVIVQSYRLGHDSATVAHELGVLPPMVRLWLYRCNRMQRGLKKAYDKRNGGTLPQTHPWPADKVWKLFQLRAMGYSKHKCATFFKTCETEILRRWRQNFGDLEIGSCRRGRKPFLDAVIARCRLDEKIQARVRANSPRS